MIDIVQDIHIEYVDGQFVATVPKIDATVYGQTHDEALTNAQRAIMSRMIAEAQKRKAQSQKGHTGA